MDYVHGVDPLLVITHSSAGQSQRGGDDDPLEEALEVLRAETSVEVASPGHPGELDGVLHRAGSRPIVIAGGDGSLHAIISALHRRHDLADTTLALLPLGTGNDFARAVGLPLEPAEAARVVLTGVRRRMDLLVDEVGEVVVNNVHTGAGAEAARVGAGWKEKLGKVGYPIGALITAVRPPVVRLRVEVDGEVLVDYDERVLQVAVGNGTSVGGGTELTPDADPRDGLADVMVSLAVGPLARFGYAADLLLRRHHDRNDVRTARGRTVSVCGSAFWCSADGEMYGPERRRTWRVEPAAYTLIVPGPGRPAGDPA